MDGKVKYAKWKAADIAKAYREGRVPIPGPAGSQFHSETLPATSGTSELPPEAEGSRISPPLSMDQPEASSRTSPKRKTVSPRMSPDDISRANRIHSPRHDDDMLSPGRWSTTATPGLDLARDSSSVSLDQENNWHETSLNAKGSSKLRRAWVSADMEGAASDEEPVLNGTLPSHVPFSPSAGEPLQNVSSSPPKEQRVIYTQKYVPPVPPPPPFLPSSSPPKRSPPQARSRGLSISSQELPPGFVPSSLVPPPVIPVVSSPPRTALFAPSSPPRVVASPPAPVAATYLPQDFELTPSTIAKVQKHCRFAISSLDYEDAEQARKELRTALALLGG